MSLEEVRKNPLRAKASAVPESLDIAPWQPVITKFTTENAIRISAKRNYEH